MDYFDERLTSAQALLYKFLKALFCCQIISKSHFVCQEIMKKKTNDHPLVHCSMATEKPLLRVFAQTRPLNAHNAMNIQQFSTNLLWR